MGKKEVKTDLWVWNLLKDAGIEADAQGSSIIEINDALKTASKSGTGNPGYPEFCAVVKDYLLVIEDKAELSKHIKLNDKNLISTDTKDIKSYAVNGALFYGQHLANNTSYKKIIVFGVSGDEKRHRITPIYVDETEYYRELPDVESFILFNESNIDEYYIREILKEDTATEKETAEILKDAAELHNELYVYGSLEEVKKPLIVSGILLALRESDFGGFSIDNLTGDSVETDGTKIYNAIKANLTRANVLPEVKRDKLLSQFGFIKDEVILNEKHEKLGKTPLKHFTMFIKSRIYNSIRYTNSAEDYLGRFYGEFMSYSGGDGQSLGIVLTPKHITELFCELLELKVDDIVIDPCCGTAGFLIAAMHYLLQLTDDVDKKKNIRQKQLHGIEQKSYMFTIATTNMILRGDGKSNLINDDFLKQDANKLQLKQATVGMLNPPYSQGSKDKPEQYELSFAEHLLDSLVVGGRCAIIVPQSSMTGKTEEETLIKMNILKKHTLEGVITLSKETFYEVGTMPCIAIFTAGEPHPSEKMCKFINYEDDGFVVKRNVGLVETENSKDKKQHLIDVWFDKIESETKFCVKSRVEYSDEWLHSFYYFNDSVPVFKDFESVVGDYLSFEFSMIMRGKKVLFGENSQREISLLTSKKVPNLDKKNWKGFSIEELFNINSGKRLTKANMQEGDIPFIGASEFNNGVTNFVSNNNKSLDQNVLGVNYDGSVCRSFYHPYSCLFSDSVKRFSLKATKGNKYLYLFFAALIFKQKVKYTYGYKFNETRMKRQLIMVPINRKGEPDYEYMEQYIVNLMISKYNEYLKYKG